MTATSIIGFLGTSLDNGFNEKRWQRWRPTISLCLHDDLKVDELHILYDANDKRLLDIVTLDVKLVSPNTQVIGHSILLEDPWDFADVYAQLYDFVIGFNFNDNTDYLVHLTTGTHVAQICWFILVETGFIPAGLIQTSPLLKPDKNNPQGHYQIIDLNLSRYEGLRERFEAEKQQHWKTLQANLTTQNNAYKKLIEDIEKVATRSTAPILLMGATGAGKSQLAKQIYNLKCKVNSTKLNAPPMGRFVEVNCATLRGDTAMSVLFGHVKGAFTGAASNRDGLLKSADGGMLFLDEIGELGLDEQAMLLTALEDQRFHPVGSDHAITVSFELMAGTNKDLRKAVNEGAFRADLFARLNTWTFYLPSLKDRLEDLPANIDYELARIGSEEQHQYRFEKKARLRYQQYAMSSQAKWSGNFRDLSASIIRLTTLSDSKVIQLENVEAEITRLNELWALNDSEISSLEAKYNDSQCAIKNLDSTVFEDKCDRLLVQLLDENIAQFIDPFDKAQLAYVISVCYQHKNQAAAGRYLYSNSRSKLKNPNDSDRLSKYLSKFNIKFDDIKKLPYKLN